MAKFMNQTLHRVAKAVAEPVLQEDQEEVGMGDVIHGVTSRLGVRHCSKCAKRKQAANRKLSFGRPK
jgi:hypothetical protein